MSKIRIFLVDDHYVVCEGLRHMLEQEEEFCVVGEAASGKDALAKLQTTPVDVVLFDARLADMDGIEILRMIKQLWPNQKVIILTSYGEEYLGASVDAGADGFFLKRGNRAELVQAIHEVVRGGKPIDSLVAPGLLQALYASSRYSAGSLSSREIEVLALAAGGHSNKELAQLLEITHQTVKNHISSVLRKLDVNDRTHAVTVALRKGWIPNPVPASWKSYG